MAKFEHKRFPALVLQDNEGVWAQFTPEDREFGENKIKVGVFETDDDQLAERLRTCTDPDLVEVDAPSPAKRTRAKASE